VTSSLGKLIRLFSARPGRPRPGQHPWAHLAALRRVTASTTAGGVMLVGLPLGLEYVVRPGDTLSEIAERHGTTVARLVDRNGLHRSGDQVVAGQSLRVPSRATPTRHRRIDPDARRIVRYTVRPGDTPSGLAVRFHAWTAELVAMNGSVLRIGERIRIPVVVAAAARDRRTRDSRPARAHRRPAKDRAKDRANDRARDRARHRSRQRARDDRDRARQQHSHARSGPSRATVRRVIARTARRHGVDPQLALAVSWQEAGWQMHHVSSADAVGAMQVIPSTGVWMSGVVGRRLDLHRLHDNVTAGVVLLKLLRDAAPPKIAIAGYYQGLAGVREHGMYDDTRRYVANVLALKHRFEKGQYPA
jgi:soluble lytic murein transglycosylase-like protein